MNEELSNVVGVKPDYGEEELEHFADVLEQHGYKITRPPREIKDEYTFERVWDLYQKKVGDKDRLRRKWNSMSKKDREAATKYIPVYVKSRPDKNYRLNFQTFLNQKRWHDEIISSETKKQKVETIDYDKLIHDGIVKDEETKRHEKRQRIYRMIEAVKENPKSSMYDVLVGMYENGLLKDLNIDWKPYGATSTCGNKGDSGRA